MTDFQSPEEALIFLAAIIIIGVVFVFLWRWIGAWMLRIDEVIKELKNVVKELKELNLRIREK